MSAFDGIATERLREFVLAREKDGGGFAATPQQPATVQDTFYGLDILAALDGRELLPQTTRIEAHRAFLQARRRGPDMRWRLAWFLARARELAGLAPTVVPVARDADSAEEWFCRRRLTAAGPAGGAGRYPLRTCRDRYFHLRLCEEGMSAGEREEQAAWFTACQNPDGGFGFFPGTTSYIENSRFCLAGLALLGTAPRRPGAARAFIVMCQRKNGGFARNSRAAPFLDASWHAVRALLALP